LKANINTLTNRLKYNKSKRPIISDLNENELQEFIAKHLFDRSYYYNQCKYTITVNDKTPTEIVNEIEKLLF
jgi:shikimate kinase